LAPEAVPGLDRLELRFERLSVTFRFTFAFHAREVRFERDLGDGFERVFPETFSFHIERHDPTELFLQLDDLMRKPRLLSPRAHRRDARELVMRLLANVPRYLGSVSERLAREGRLDEAAGLRFAQDVALLSQILLRFIETANLDEQRPVRVGGFLLRKLGFRSLLVLMHGRVEPDYLERYVRGEVDPVDPADDPSESGFFHALEGKGGEPDPEIVNRLLVRMAERAFYLWLDGVCLDEENQAFEKEDSPFASREREVAWAITAGGAGEVQRAQDLVAFLRRPSRDCFRLLKKLETWFFRQYDVHRAASMIEHAAALQRRDHEGGRTLSRHGPANYVLALTVLTAPFVAAVFLYDRAPTFFNLLCAAEVALVNAVAAWFLLYRFCWKRDLTFFYTSVPRIVAGIIVGYLPVFLIDEIWDLASRPAVALLALSTLMGLATLLYLFIEVQRRLGDTTVAFSRARGIFVLGLLEALGLGIVMTNLVGPFMVMRNWSVGAELPLELLRVELEPMVGQLPLVLGVEPLYVFPSALLIMTPLSFFIGIFLQLMWEELPITEPL